MGRRSVSNSESDAIRRQMASIRRELDEDVGAVVEQAKELTDWRNFVKRHPFLSVTAVAAIGYLVVPQRLNVISPSAEALEKLAKKNRLVVKPKTDDRRQASVASPIVNLVVGAIFRSALTMAGEQVGKVMTPPANDSEHVSRG